MVDQSRPESDARESRKSPTSWPLIVVLIPFVAGAFYWWGDYNSGKKENQMNITMGEVARERDKAQIAEEFAKSSLDQERERNLRIESENRKLRDSNMVLRDSISNYSEEIKKYTSRIVEITEPGAAELFDNTFVVTLEYISGETSELSPNTAYVGLYYVGDNPELLERPQVKNSIMEVGEALAIEYKNRWYCARLLSIDEDKKMARFSQFIANTRPSDIY